MIERLIRSFLYHPERLPRRQAPPAWVQGAEEVFFPIADGTEIHGLFWAAAPGRPTILFFHGNAQTVFEWALIREELAPLACGMLLVDYPGYGKSGGAPSESALYASGRGAHRYLTEEKRVPPERVVLFGKSLGGGVATELASAVPVGGMVLESTFCSIPEVASRLFPFLPMGWLFRSERYDSASRIGDIDVPILVVHGERDELIPCRQGRALFERAREPKELYLVPGAGHNDVAMVAGPEYGRRLRSWLDGALDRAPTLAPS